MECGALGPSWREGPEHWALQRICVLSENLRAMRPSIAVQVEQASVSASNTLIQRSVYNVWVRSEGESRRIPYTMDSFVELREEVRLAHLAPPLSAPFPERHPASAAASALRSFGLGEPTRPSMAQSLNAWLSELCLRAELSAEKPLALPHALRCTLSNWLRIPQPRECDASPTAPASDGISAPPRAAPSLSSTDAPPSLNDAQRPIAPPPHTHRLRASYQAAIAARSRRRGGFAYRFDDATSGLAGANAAADVVDGCGAPPTAAAAPCRAEIAAGGVREPTPEVMCERRAEPSSRRRMLGSLDRNAESSGTLPAKKKRELVSGDGEGGAAVEDKENGSDASTSHVIAKKTRQAS